MEEILEEIRKTPLLQRIDTAISMISGMCREGRCPRMSIPVRPQDEDIFITTTLGDAKSLIIALDATVFREADLYKKRPDRHALFVAVGLHDRNGRSILGIKASEKTLGVTPLQS